MSCRLLQPNVSFFVPSYFNSFVSGSFVFGVGSSDLDFAGAGQANVQRSLQLIFIRNWSPLSARISPCRQTLECCCRRVHDRLYPSHASNGSCVVFISFKSNGGFRVWELRGRGGDASHQMRQPALCHAAGVIRIAGLECWHDMCGRCR